MLSLAKWLVAVEHIPVLMRATMRIGHRYSDDVHMIAAADWLLAAQRAGGGGGYAHSFHFLYGWQPPYPETTGYILPTLLRVHRHTGNALYRESAARAAKWLVSVQRDDGAFTDLQGRPQVFDTGQILIGLNDLVECAPDLADIDALRRAAEWLVHVQERDGSFVRYAYNGIPHAYYARVGAALTIAGRILGDERVRAAGVANLRWTVAQQQANGFFRHLSFDDAPPFLHTMVYVLEGLLDGYAETDDQSLFEAALAFAGKLRVFAEKRDGLLRSQYLDDYSVANAEKCLTGLAQWAGVAFRLAGLTRDDVWRWHGREALDFLKMRQILSSDYRLHGGLPGSAPINGCYMRAAIPNWGQKFFIDAMFDKFEK